MSNEQLDYYSMSEEEFLNTPPPDLSQTEENTNDQPDSDEEKEEETIQDQTTEVDDEDEQEEEENTELEADTEEDDAEQASDSKVSDDGTTKKETNKDKDTPEDKETKSTEVDFEAEYKRILAPFRANGKEIQVDSIDDALSLMKMGANYNKQMAAIKPARKVLKLLENNNLLSEEKLSFLIELDKKNPEAVHKLIKDSGIDLMEYDADKAGEYRPKIHTVSDEEVALDTVLDEIQDSKSYTRTLGIISNEWDAASKQVITKNPQLVKIINDHVDRGIYDLIAKEVERGKMLGRLNGMSDLDAYKYVGDAIQAQGGFDQLGSSQGNETNKLKVVQPKPKAEDSDKLKEKKRAASSSKTSKTSSTPADFNPLQMSDEEFEKYAEKKYR